MGHLAAKNAEDNKANEDGEPAQKRAKTSKDEDEDGRRGRQRLGIRPYGPKSLQDQADWADRVFAKLVDVWESGGLLRQERLRLFGLQGSAVRSQFSCKGHPNQQMSSQSMLMSYEHSLPEPSFC